MTVHVVVRDFPETLVIFRKHGVGRESGASSVTESAEDPDLLLEDLRRATAWRGSR
jgi:hypothetical protein